MFFIDPLLHCCPVPGTLDYIRELLGWSFQVKENDSFSHNEVHRKHFTGRIDQPLISDYFL